MGTGTGGAALVLSGRRLPIVGTARLYVCGITPYDVTHLGHAATFIWADVAAAVLRLAGLSVTTCRNVTDVDDVLTSAAGAHGHAYDEFALYQEYLFGKDMAALRVHQPAREPRARHYVVPVQQLAAALLATGAAYESGGYVYFRGAETVAASGLSPTRAHELLVEYGDDADHPGRDDPFDVPVWRPSVTGEPGWPSPWGMGRPGWHAECAAMALSVLGPAVDVLAGGADLAFPHHAYQAAMVEAASGVAPFARARLHVGTVCVDGAKMAKSAGNLVLVSELLRDHPPAAVRLLVLDRDWSAPWEYRPRDLTRAAMVLDELYTAAARPEARPAAGREVPVGEAARGGVTRGEAARREVIRALLDNLDVPRALAVAREAGGEAARDVLRILALT